MFGIFHKFLNFINFYVSIWKEFISQIQNSLTHPNLSSYQLSNKIHFTNQIQPSNRYDFLIFAIPCQKFRELLQKLDFTNINSVIISASKGLEKQTGKTMSEVISENHHEPLWIIRNHSRVNIGYIGKHYSYLKTI